MEELRRKKVITGLIPCLVIVSKPTDIDSERTSQPGRIVQVYTRRRRNPSVQPPGISDVAGS